MIKETTEPPYSGGDGEGGEGDVSTVGGGGHKAMDCPDVRDSSDKLSGRQFRGEICLFEQNTAEFPSQGPSERRDACPGCEKKNAAAMEFSRFGAGAGEPDAFGGKTIGYR